MSEAFNDIVKKAENDLAAARTLLSADLPTNAVVHCYYAYFWLVRGLLLEKGIITKRHSGVRDMFSLHYIKTGEIPQRFSEHLAILFHRRQLSNYDPDGEFPADEVAYLLSLVEDFMTFIKENYA